ncbi:MAG: hypothetical protein ACRDZQ_15660, partial [Acidimicrobiales bacterium]
PVRPYRRRGRGRGRQDLDQARVAALARRLWVLERRRIHDEYRNAGIAVAEWERFTSVDAVVRELETGRRARRRGA